jgi:glutamate synthase domain-containing protein 3
MNLSRAFHTATRLADGTVLVVGGRSKRLITEVYDPAADTWTKVGERFAARNVVEGVGDHACSYMTGGKIAILGPIGNNFAAGMSRGVAYIWDPTGERRDRVNPAMVQVNTVSGASDKGQLKMLLRAHWDFTGGAVAKRILSNWDKSCEDFLIVVPRQHPDIRDEKVEGVKALVAGTEYPKELPAGVRQAMSPPSIAQATPLTNAASSEHIHRTRAATSSGVPARFMLWRA